MPKADLLGEGTGGPSNIRLDPDLVWNSILTACREALAQAGLQESDLKRIHAGMGAAGAGQTSAVERLLSRAHPFASFEIETDAHTAWLGAFNGGDGAILIVGTGSCGYGGTSGDCHYVGGWGYEISDEGSGAAIGRELLRRCIWAHDGRTPSTPLSDAVLAEFNNDLESPGGLGRQGAPRDYGRYAPLVLDHAETARSARHRDRCERRRRIGRDRHAPPRSRRARHLPVRRPGRAACGPGFRRPFSAPSPPPVADAVDGAILLARIALQGRQHMTEPSGEALAFLPLDDGNPTPLYLQLQQSIEEAVRKGALKADAALPGERDLAKQLGISRVTVRKAITGLVQKGVLVQRWGSGTFIAPQMRLEQPLSRLSSFTDDMSARGLKSSAVMLSQSTGPASTDELMALGLSPGDLVSRVNRLRLANGIPMAIENAVVPSRVLPDPSLVKQSLYAVLHEQGFMPTPRPATTARGSAERGTGLPARRSAQEPGALYRAPLLHGRRAKWSSSPRPITGAMPMISWPS